MTTTRIHRAVTSTASRRPGVDVRPTVITSDTIPLALGDSDRLRQQSEGDTT
ncbi:MAG: hypothetical protein ABI345_07500 [Jatrophihabitans sp.]